jgi:excisionase family DNA binding protein
MHHNGHISSNGLCAFCVFCAIIGVGGDTMALVSTSILSRSRLLAQNLRQEGRVEDAKVVDELVESLEQQTARSQYATTGEVALRLGVSRQTVVNWIKRGFLPGLKLGGRLVVPTSELTRVEEVARLLDIVDAARLPSSPEEIDDVSRNERDQWTWIGKDA